MANESTRRPLDWDTVGVPPSVQDYISRGDPVRDAAGAIGRAVSSVGDTLGRWNAQARTSDYLGPPQAPAQAIGGQSAEGKIRRVEPAARQVPFDPNFQSNYDARGETTPAPRQVQAPAAPEPREISPGIFRTDVGGRRTYSNAPTGVGLGSGAVTGQNTGAPPRMGLRERELQATHASQMEQLASRQAHEAPYKQALTHEAEGRGRVQDEALAEQKRQKATQAQIASAYQTMLQNKVPPADIERRMRQIYIAAGMVKPGETKQDTAKLDAAKQMLAYGEPEQREQASQYLASVLGQRVEGYADGGAIGAAPPAYAGVPEPAQHDPVMAQYGQYLKTATANKLTPVPFDQFASMVSTARQQFAQQPTAGFAEGGPIEAQDVPVGGKQVVGPIPGTDTIPAVIDGERRAALDSGEFVIPKHVVKAKGTEFFEKLIAQYAENNDGPKPDR